MSHWFVLWQPLPTQRFNPPPSKLVKNLVSYEVMEEDGGPGRAAALYSHFWMLRRVQRGYACFDAYARSLETRFFGCCFFFQGSLNATHLFGWIELDANVWYIILYYIFLHTFDGFPL